MIRLSFFRGVSAVLGVVALIAGTACAQGAATGQPSPTATVVAPSGTATAVAPNPTPTATADPGVGPKYLDDRSTPQSLIGSLVDAINRKQYLRAYSYWEPSAQAPAFADFTKGYASTDSVQLVMGTVSGDAGAGQMYYSVPAVLTVKMTSGEAQTQTNCYTLHLGNPAIQDQPPFRPLGIQSAVIAGGTSGSSPAELLANACSAQAGHQLPVPTVVTSDPASVDKSRYVDNRSGPVDVVRSYYNAVNRREYDRAYSYWESGAAVAQIPPYDQFKQGYAKTASVDVITGVATSNAGAGQFIYLVPVTLKSATTDGAMQTFVGCYRIQQNSPDFQSTPPFQPMSIRAASITEVPSGGNAAELMLKACPGL